ncbi:MAG TPA: AAA family ATPase [Longimicrobiales bacterium]|nr:AAA family ATPase [Longimicrobiales bacterium]
MSLPEQDQDRAEGPTFPTAAELLADPSFLRAPEVVVPRLAWKRRVTLLVGEPKKAGKSTLARGAAASKTHGVSFLGEPCGEAGTVLWCGWEEDLGDLLRNSVAMQVDPERMHVGVNVQTQAEVRAAILRIRPALTVIDSLVEFAAKCPDPPKSGDAQGWRRVVGYLSDDARESGSAVLLIHHSRKEDGASRDSNAITAKVDASLEIHPHPTDPAARKIKPYGRWPMEDFKLRLEGAAYTLDGLEVSIDTRVLRFITANAGCSTRKVREGVTGRAAEVDDALRRLERGGFVVDRGIEGRGSAWFAVEGSQGLRVV